jgi:pimeloyl-ACP methyl ester carboxylesterase
MGYSNFKKISMPALVLLGDRDEFFSVEDAVALYRKTPNAEITIVPGAKHSFFR